MSYRDRTTRQTDESIHAMAATALIPSMGGQLLSPQWNRSISQFRRQHLQGCSSILRKESLIFAKSTKLSPWSSLLPFPAVTSLLPPRPT